MPRSWTINGRFLAQPLTGVQRYAREITLALDQELSRNPAAMRDLSVTLAVPGGVECDLNLRAIKTFATRAASGYAWEQLILPLQVRGGLLSLGNVGPLAVRRQIVCMHDMTTRSCPGSYSRPYRIAHKILQPALARRVTSVVTVSNFSAAELRRHRVCRDAPDIVAPNGHEHVLRWQPRHSETSWRAAGPTTIVVVGSPAPHKNLGLLIGLSAELDKVGLRLAIVGAADPKVFAISKAAHSPSIAWLGRLSDHEIAALLRDSLCLALPSLTEGFGLPALEAMTLGCPVVVSNCASLPELCGDAALYASPVEPRAWLDAFCRLRDDSALRTTLAMRGRKRSRTFSWHRSAQRYLDAMATIDGLAPVSAREVTVLQQSVRA